MNWFHISVDGVVPALGLCQRRSENCWSSGDCNDNSERDMPVVGRKQVDNRSDNEIQKTNPEER